MESASHHRPPAIRSPPGSIAAAAAIGLAGSLLSVLLNRDNHLATLWLPNAFLVSMLAIQPRWRIAPVTLIGCFAMALVNVGRGESVSAAMLMATANGASISINVTILRRLFPEGPSFARPSYILRIALAAVVGGVIAACIGAPTIALYHSGNLAHLFLQWLAADALAMMLFVPLIVQIADYHAAPRADRPRLSTIVIITGLVFAAAAFSFGVQVGPTLYLLPPVVVAATLVLGPLGAALGVAVSAVAALAFTFNGFGPVARIYDGWHAQTLFLELYCVVLIFSTAPVAGTLAHIRRISRDLEASRERFSSLVDNLGEVIFRTDARGRMAFLNPAWEKLTGREVEASYGRSFLRFIAPEDRAAARIALRPLFEGHDGECRVVLRCPHPDGPTKWCEVTAEIEREGDGGLLGVSGTIRDVTARKAGELALSESERRFRTIAEYATDMIVKTDAATTCSYVSPSVHDILGYRPDEIVGRPLIAFVHPDDVESRHRVRAAILDDPARDSTGRLRMRRRDGRWLWMEAKSRLIDEDPGRPQILSVLRDVEKNKRLEEALVAARDAAEATARARSDFVAMISHEIRTPMTGILGMIDLLRDTDSPAERDRFVRVLEGSSRTLMRMLDDVLDVTKLEAGAVRVEVAPFDLRALIVEVAALFQSSAAARGVTIVAAFDGTDPASVAGDSTRLRQVLGNLVGNAVKFTPEGRIVVKAALEGDDCWRFEVHDQGIGIPEDALETIFQPFAQADASTTRRFGGTGLGLTIARRLVEALGGTLKVASEVGVGSCFSFALTLPAAPHDAIRSAAATPLAAQSPERALSLLVAEDNPVNRLLIATLLKRMGHRALTVDNGQAAVIAARQGGYDAVLMDLQMPLMDGIEAALAIRALSGAASHVPIIAITADRQVEGLIGFAAARFDAVIAKPIDRAALFDTLAAIALMPVTPPDLDHVALADAAAHVGLDGVERLLALFLRDGEARAALLGTAVAAGDLAVVRREAHALAGGAAAACARRLEATARTAMRPRSTLADGVALIAALDAAMIEVGGVLAMSRAAVTA